MIRDDDWKILRDNNKTKLEESSIGDIFIAQRLDGGIEGRYVRRNFKKRGFQSVDEEGFVSVYDIRTVHSNCKFVKYATT